MYRPEYSFPFCAFDWFPCFFFGPSFLTQDGSLLLQQRCDAPVRSLCYLPAAEAAASTDSVCHILCGTDRGTLSLLQLDYAITNNAMNNSPSPLRVSLRRCMNLFSMTGQQISPLIPSMRSSNAAIIALCTVDMFSQQLPEIALARDDGSLELYSFAQQSLLSPSSSSSATSSSNSASLHYAPNLMFQRALETSVTSLQSGFVCGQRHPDIVVSTFGGKVIVFSSEVASNVGHVAPQVLREVPSAVRAPMAASPPPPAIVASVSEVCVCVCFSNVQLFFVCCVLICAPILLGFLSSNGNIKMQSTHCAPMWTSCVPKCCNLVTSSPRYHPR